MVCTRKHVKIAYLANSNDQELVTSVKCALATSQVIPLLAILPIKVFLPWYHPNLLLDDYQTTHSSLGYNNSELAMEWLKHFEKHSQRGTAKRLLLLDGHKSYINVEFLD
jgi:DDE superfamily endonuclease